MQEFSLYANVKNTAELESCLSSMTVLLKQENVTNFFIFSHNITLKICQTKDQPQTMELLHCNPFEPFDKHPVNVVHFQATQILPPVSLQGVFHLLTTTMGLERIGEILNMESRMYLLLDAVQVEIFTIPNTTNHLIIAKSSIQQSLLNFQQNLHSTSAHFVKLHHKVFSS